MVITQAKLADIPDLVKLLGWLFEQECEFESKPDLQGRSLKKIILDPAIGIIYIAKKSDRILGMVSLLFTESTALGSRVSLLEDMVVTPNDRSQGIGSKLLKHAIEESNRLGCKRITLLADFENHQARRFYQKHGFHKSAMVPYRFIIESVIK